MNSKLINSLSALLILVLLSNCGGKTKTNTRDIPTNAQERARKNVDEGRGASIGSILRGRSGSGNFAFSSSNPMWRASLEIMDFLPLNTVDYSGGMIITDWYSDNSSTNESLKISIRFLGTEVRSDNVKIIVHKKSCTLNQNCNVFLINNSKINDELRSSILRKASQLEIEDKKNK
jgi:hypothetical protein